MKKAALYIFLLGITALILVSPENSLQYAKSGLTLCYDIIIPALFPFFVCSGLLIYSGICNDLARLFGPVMRPLFNVNGSGAAAFVLGIVSGYPLGALTACRLYEGCYLSKSEAERLLAFCNNSGPLFILGSVGTALYHSPKIGTALYISHILAALSVGVIFRFYGRGTFSAPSTEINQKKADGGEIFSAVLSNSLQSILTVCGAVVFFSVISNAAAAYLPLAPSVKPLILGLVEFTTGVNAIYLSEGSLYTKLLLSAFVVGFAGLSVHVQVIGIISKYRLRLLPYFCGKLLHGIFSVIYLYIILHLYPGTLSVFSASEARLDISGAFMLAALYSLLGIAALAAAAAVSRGILTAKKHSEK